MMYHLPTDSNSGSSEADPRDDGHVRDPGQTGPAMSTSKEAERHDVEGMENQSSLPANQPPLGRVMSELRLPSSHFGPLERQVLWALSNIERDAMKAKLDFMNKGRDGKNRYLED